MQQNNEHPNYYENKYALIPDKNNRADSDSITLSLDSLANYPEKLITTGNKYSFLSDKYNRLKECNCHRFYDRTNTKHDQLEKGILNLPYGFKTPLDFFESALTEFLAKEFSALPEIHIVSFGSGYLLREVIFIAKLIKELEKSGQHLAEQKIILHAIDTIYHRQVKFGGDFFLTDQAYFKTESYQCQQQFRDLMHELQMDVSLITYDSVESYNLQHAQQYPVIILSIDVTLRFDSDFPALLEKPKYKSYTEKNYTQEGILAQTKQLVANGSFYATLTHLETNKGMFLILEQKENLQWSKKWLHSIWREITNAVAPPKAIQQILHERERLFYLSDAGQYELLQRQRFLNAPLSRAVKERDERTMDSLMELKNISLINAQSEDGFTALHWAAMNRDSTKIQLLIANGACPDIRNIYGKTPVDYYLHQVTAEDFKDFISHHCYLALREKSIVSTDECMPEFNEIYRHEEDIESAFGWTRNGISVNISKFYPAKTKDLEQQSAVKNILSMEKKALITDSSYKTNIKPTCLPAPLKQNHPSALPVTMETRITPKTAFATGAHENSFFYFLSANPKNLETLTRALDETPGNIALRLNRAETYLGMGEYEKAHADYFFVKSKYPLSNEAIAGLKKCERYLSINSCNDVINERFDETRHALR